MTSVELKSPTAPDSVTVTESNELESNDEEGLCGVIADCGTVNVDVDCACTLTIAKAVAVASSDNFNIVKLVIVECQRSCRVQYNSSEKAVQSQGSQAMKQVVLSLVCNGRSAQSQAARLVTSSLSNIPSASEKAPSSIGSLYDSSVSCATRRQSSRRHSI